MQTVEAKYPNVYQYHLSPDQGTTGRFEVTFYKSLEALNEQKAGVLLHSKKQSGKFPDYQGAFFVNLEAAVNKPTNEMSWWSINLFLEG